MRRHPFQVLEVARRRTDEEKQRVKVVLQMVGYMEDRWVFT